MKCLFFFPNAPLSPNYAGGSSRYLGAFLALTRLGIDVHVVRILDEQMAGKVIGYELADPEQSRIKERAKSWTDIRYSIGNRRRRVVKNLLEAFSSPISYSCPEIRLVQDEFRRLVIEIAPDFIWAEWLSCAALVASKDVGVPWIYGHHDMMYKILKLRATASKRGEGLRGRLVRWSTRRTETTIARKSNAIITGSVSEAAQLAALGARKVITIDTTYEAPPPVSKEACAQQPARVVHLGGLSTTANHLGLMSLLKEQAKAASIPHSQAVKPELFIIGDTSQARRELTESLHAAGAKMMGHVRNLESVLRPFDIAIIPYEFDTGSRTKLPLLFSHSQVVVTTEAAVTGSKDVRNNINCFALKSVSDFPAVIARLSEDPGLREKVGREARATFERYYTHDAQLSNYKIAVDELRGAMRLDQQVDLSSPTQASPQQVGM